MRLQTKFYENLIKNKFAKKKKFAKKNVAKLLKRR